METLSRNEKIAQARKMNKNCRTKKIHKQKNKTDTLYSAGSGLSDNNSGTAFSSRSFQLRLVAASLLFLIFSGMKETNLAYHDISCEKVMEIVGNNSGMEAAEEKIISAFHRLH